MTLKGECIFPCITYPRATCIFPNIFPWIYINNNCFIYRILNKQVEVYTLLRYNLLKVKFTHLKCEVWWVLAIVYTHVTTNPINPKYSLMSFCNTRPNPWPRTTADLCFLSLELSDKWNQTPCSLCLVIFLSTILLRLIHVVRCIKN